MKTSKQIAEFIIYLNSSDIKDQKYVNKPVSFYGNQNL